MQTGFRYAFQEGFDAAVQVDGDGQHDPAELSKLLGPLRENQADIVVGSRFAGDAVLPRAVLPPNRDRPLRADDLADRRASESRTPLPASAQ